MSSSKIVCEGSREEAFLIVCVCVGGGGGGGGGGRERERHFLAIYWGVGKNNPWSGDVGSSFF